MPLRPFLVPSALILTGSLFCQPTLPAQEAPAAAPAAPLRVFSREVVIDVNVTDAKGAPIRGLTRDQFTVLDNGHPITPRSFTEHRSDQQPDTTSPANPSLPPNTFSNAGPPEGQRPLNMLLLDALNVPIPTQAIEQKRLADFVDHLAPGTRLAVFSLSATGQLSLLQGFTTDSDLLKKAIHSHKLDMQVPPLEDFGQEPDGTVPAPQANGNKQSAKILDQMANTQAGADKLDQNIECNHGAARSEYTYIALSQIARYVSGMPGRKNLIWYTGLYPAIMRDKQGTNCYDDREDTRVVGERLGHSNVVVYPIDPRTLDSIAKNGPGSYTGQIHTAEELRMEAMAEDSGGKAFYNNNDLAAAAAQAIDAGANYYTVTYIPPGQVADTRLHTVSIKVTDQPDLTLVYRHGYHATPPGETVSQQAIQKATPLQTAMMRGALQPTEVLFHVGVTPAAAPDSALPPGNTADPKLMKPPFRHLTLAYTIDLNGIQFDLSTDDRYHGQFEYAVNVYDASNGKLLNSNIMAAKPALPANVYQSMLSTGANLRQEIDLPAKGDCILRVGVRDLTTDHVGAIEIPISAIH